MLVKTVIGGLATKVALGVGVAAASVTAAGAAGVLPQPAQHALASVVEVATPFQLPDPSTVTALADDDDPSSPTTTTTTTLVGDEDDEGTGGQAGERKVNHGACVSAAARDKAESGAGSHGKTVSSIARSDCGKTKTTSSSTTSTTLAGSTTTSSSTTSTTVASAERSGNSGPGSSNSGRGGGNSGSSGNGNSGSGNSDGGNSGKN